MKTKVVLLFPFDLGLELDFSGRETQTMVHEVSSHELPRVFFDHHPYSDASTESQLYRFGVGVIKISFTMDYDLNLQTKLACHAERVSIGDTPILDWCQSRVNELITRAQEFATYRYDLRLKEGELYPLFFIHPSQVENADKFIRKNYKAIYGSVAGEPNFDQLSDFVFQNEPLGNFGYYENEIICLKRFGAVISSSEYKTILDMVALSYAQYWSLKSYHFVLDKEISSAQKLLEDLTPYYKFWKIPSRYHRFSADAIDFGKDKIAIVDSLYNISTNIPKIETDWHLRTLYKNMARVFNIDEYYKTLETKLDHVEESYNQAREFLSTNFFILLDIIFFMWLGWGIFDTLLLLYIANK